MIMGLLDITLSRPEQENDALLWANCIHLLWHWWFLDVFFLSKLFFLLHYPAFLSEHLFRLPTSFVERWLALLASASQKWKVGWARHASSFWEEDLLFKGTMRCFCFYAVTNAAIDVRVSCGIRVATGLSGCLIMENETVSLWLTYWKIVWASQVQFEMKTAGFDIGCREASLFSENEPGPCMCVRLCAPQRWEE